MSRENVVDRIKENINAGNGKTLKDYPIRDLVRDAEKLGRQLSDQGLKSNQMRKFLDAINRAKAELAQSPERDFKRIQNTVVLLQPKFAYAAAKQEGKSRRAAGALNEVMKAALKKVHDPEDFDRLVALLESIVAYHKEAETYKESERKQEK